MTTEHEIRIAACLLLACLPSCSSSGSLPSSSAAGATSSGGSVAIGGGGATAGAGSAGSAAGQSGAGGPVSAGAGGQSAGGTAGTATAGSGGASTDQPPAGVPPNYHLVYSQPFADAASLSDLVFANPTQWKHDPAGFVFSTGASYAPPYRSPFSVAIIASIQVKSFVMDAEMLQTSPDGDAHRDMVLIWNFVSPSQFYYAHVSTAHDAVAHNILIVNNADRKAISTTFTTGYDWGRNVWKKLRVIRDADSGAMSVLDLDTPDQPLLTANDKTFGNGYLGFGSFDNSGRVRNVKVWSAESTPGAPAFFSAAK